MMGDTKFSTPVLNSAHSHLLESTILL